MTKTLAKDVARYATVTADSKTGTAAGAYALGRLSGNGADATPGDEGRTLVGGIATAIGKGLLAGLVGTAAMTLSSAIEAKLRGRGSSTAPADATERVLDIEGFESEEAQERFGNLVHWAYGTGWGAVRGLLAATGMPTTAATGAHLGAVWGTELVMLPALDVSPPATEWGPAEVAIDAWHHAVYAVATGLAYDRIG